MSVAKRHANLFLLITCLFLVVIYLSNSVGTPQSVFSLHTDVKEQGNTDPKTTELKVEHDKTSSAFIEPKVLIDSFEKLTIEEQEQEQAMDLAVEKLHLYQFDEYLGERKADASEYKEFFTNERWALFYEDMKYLPGEIAKLISVREQYLGDISQSGKKYYFFRWGKAPHKMLTDSVAYKTRIYSSAGAIEKKAIEYAVDDISSEYGIDTEFVNKMVMPYLKGSIKNFELNDRLFSNSKQKTAISDDTKEYATDVRKYR